ncbi:MAG: hypothetical protein QNL62_24590 [Gammaproteobacteria bacterium]|nr:hypothetical protein [Gammaproteobacteria bacterium]
MWLHLNFSFNSLLKGKMGLHKLPLTIAGLALFAGLNAVHASQDGLGPRITIQESSGDSCILPNEQMRREHPDLLKHDRIQTLREGLRAQADGSSGSLKPLDGSLKQCVNCHAIKDDNNNYVRIDNDQHFCVSCHQYAAVTIDCFQCHRDIPEGSGNFHALSSHKNVDYRNIVPGTYSLTVKDVANIAPEVSSDDN